MDKRSSAPMQTNYYQVFAPVNVDSQECVGNQSNREWARKPIAHKITIDNKSRPPINISP